MLPKVCTADNRNVYTACPKHTSPARSPLSHTTIGNGRIESRYQGSVPRVFLPLPCRTSDPVHEMDGHVMYRTTSGAFLVVRRDFCYGAVATDQPLLSVSRGIQLVIAVEDPGMRLLVFYTLQKRVGR